MLLVTQQQDRNQFMPKSRLKLTFHIKNKLKGPIKMFSSRSLILICKRTAISSRSYSNHRFIVPDRAYLELSGKDLSKFLQGVCTNDINKLKEHGDCIATAFLTPKGRILADAMIYCVDDNTEKLKIIIETHKLSITSLHAYLSNYKLRSKVKINQSMAYVTVLDNRYECDVEDVRRGLNVKIVGGITTIASVKDPRIVSLGTRHLFSRGQEKSIDSSGETPSGDGGNFQNGLNCFSSTDKYHNLRLLNGLAEGPEIVNRIPLECNLDLLNYIDFAKGCYVGQELTARTKFKGLVRKRILPFLRNSLHPQTQSSPGDCATFSTVDDAVIENFQSSVVSTGNQNEVDGIGSISVSKVDDISADKTTDSRVGEILGISSRGDICCALVRLEKVLPVEPSGKLPNFECSLSAAVHSTEPDSSALDGVESLTIPVTSHVIPIRPPFWVENDPITHQRIDTH